MAFSTLLLRDIGQKIRAGNFLFAGHKRDRCDPRRTPGEILLPATFGGLIGGEERLDPEFLQSDVLRRAQCHDSAEQP